MTFLIRLVLLTALISCTAIGKAADYRSGPQAEATASARLSGSLAQAALPTPPSASPETMKLMQFLMGIAVVLLFFMLFRKSFAPVFEYLTPKLELLGYRRSPTLGGWPEALAEDEDISKFLVGFRGGPAALPSAPVQPARASISPSPNEAINESSKTQREALKEFFNWAPGHITEAGYLIERINRAPGGAEGRAIVRDKLGDLGVLIRSLKIKAGLPELVPVAQMANALDGLLKQLTERADNINPSTLRTIGGGINLLGQLCVSELRSDLATNPAIKILVVDDDAVTRFAMTAAVKKVFNQPDVAENGQAALELAGRQTYDIVFLDVRMPGMDGFEVCSRIRSQDLNRSTPVVFVTSLKDFQSQTASMVSGGNDLIGKPFLTFEIAVKALTLVLHARVKLRDQMVEDSNAVVTSETIPAGPAVPPAVTVEPGTSPAKPDGSSNSAPSTEFLAKVSARLAEMQKELQLVGQTVDEAARRDKLAALYLGSESLTRQIDLRELYPAFKLCSALQGLLKKLQDKPANVGASTLDTAIAAVEVLNDLCSGELKPDLATIPAISMLVVDDEPLARRSIVGALQAAFLKPDSAESGEAALKLAAKKKFDVIFLDVEMPEMNGYQACAKIHETEGNRATPVIFVTAHKDFSSRAEAVRSGGSDFIVKPFLFVEVTVKALTFALRNRLQNLGAANSGKGPNERLNRSGANQTVQKAV